MLMIATVTQLLVGSVDPLKLVPDVTYNVFVGMLNLTLFNW